MRSNLSNNKTEQQIKLKVDFAFKNVFGDKKYINGLNYLLHTILTYSEEEFDEISIIFTPCHSEAVLFCQRRNLTA